MSTSIPTLLDISHPSLHNKVSKTTITSFLLKKITNLAPYRTQITLMQLLKIEVITHGCVGMAHKVVPKISLILKFNTWLDL